MGVREEKERDWRGRVRYHEKTKEGNGPNDATRENESKERLRVRWGM